VKTVQINFTFIFPREMVNLPRGEAYYIIQLLPKKGLNQAAASDMNISLRRGGGSMLVHLTAMQ
jgi:hypothetical protein